MSYTVVDVVPDTDEWLLERRKSVGASEVAAVMGLSQWATPLDVYKSKHGVDRPFDPLIALLGHEAERTLSRWLVELSGLNPTLEPGFMARSVEHPFIHATPDRMWDGIPVQIKTAHEFTSHKWDEGIPTEYRVQVQTEMLVLGAPRALLVVQIGARDVRAIWEARDDRFINEHLIPTVTEFWGRVEAHEPPPPSTVAEIAEAYPSEAIEVELSDEAFDVLERITVLNSDIQAQEAERDALKVALAQYVETADTLFHGGQKVATWKSQKGRAGFDQKRFREDHPELAAEYVTQGAPFKVLRAVKQKEKK
jgi:putative phage-type endonuclease